MPRDIFTIKEAADITGITPVAIRLLIRWDVLTARVGPRVSLKQLRACQLTLSQASAVFGFAPAAGRLRQLVNAERIEVCNPGEIPKRVVFREVARLVKKLDAGNPAKNRGGRA